MNLHTKPPAGPQEAPLYLRTDVSPEEIFKAIGRLRKEARDEIDRLIRFLDKTDDYVSRELEQDDAESGIADQDGLDEQVPFRDWQNVGMV
jgi:hypothetical protein